MVAKSSKRKTKYKVIGFTKDGITILQPKTKPTHFTRAELRKAIREVNKENKGRRKAARM